MGRVPPFTCAFGAQHEAETFESPDGIEACLRFESLAVFPLCFQFSDVWVTVFGLAPERPLEIPAWGRSYPRPHGDAVVPFVSVVVHGDEAVAGASQRRGAHAVRDVFRGSVC